MATVTAISQGAHGHLDLFQGRRSTAIFRAPRYILLTGRRMAPERTQNR